MFGRYALAVGRGAHRHDLDARAPALGLTKRAATDDLLLAASAETPLLADGPALLVGQLFGGGGERLQHIPAALQDWPGNADLPPSDEVWGNFCLFRANSVQAAVYRDPSGSVPVYRCGSPGNDLFVSDGSVALELGLLAQPDIDRTFLIHWLQYPFLRTGRTGLRGVTELLPGMQLLRSHNGLWKQRPGWHPSAFIGRDRWITEPDEACSRLREVALKVVPRQAQSLGGSQMLRLSGGLDSSIIACCLGKAGMAIPCINFATAARDGNERDFARPVAQNFGFELLEVAELMDADLAVGGERPTFRPSINPLLAPFEKAIARAADARGVTTLIDGGGGDNLFCSLASTAPVLDAFLLDGPRRAATAIAQIATRADTTVWHVLRAALRRTVKRRPAWDSDRTFLCLDVLLPRPDLHPWLIGLNCPPGTREHIFSLVHIQHFLDRTALDADLLHPLLAQPLLELCLSIPSYLWVHGGRDRAMAREAFAGRLPQAVLDRRLKGSLQSMLHRAFGELREPMTALLCEGELASAGILDVASLRGALSSEAWQQDEVQLRVSELAALELWVQGWTRKPATGP